MTGVWLLRGRRQSGRSSGGAIERGCGFSGFGRAAVRFVVLQAISSGPLQGGRVLGLRLLRAATGRAGPGRRFDCCELHCCHRRRCTPIGRCRHPPRHVATSTAGGSFRDFCHGGSGRPAECICTEPAAERPAGHGFCVVAVPSARSWRRQPIGVTQHRHSHHNNHPTACGCLAFSRRLGLAATPTSEGWCWRLGGCCCACCCCCCCCCEASRGELRGVVHPRVCRLALPYSRL